MNIQALGMSPDLAALLEKARSHVMTPKEVFEQRVSWIWGQLPDGSKVSVNDIRAELERGGVVDPSHAEALEARLDSMRKLLEGVLGKTLDSPESGVADMVAALAQAEKSGESVTQDAVECIIDLAGMQQQLDAKQAVIDRLMLEYCPDEMTVEQVAEWGKHQVPVAFGYKLLKDTTHGQRSWPEDASHENGNYYNTCCDCDRVFTGHKRRHICRVCAGE